MKQTLGQKSDRDIFLLFIFCSVISLVYFLIYNNFDNIQYFTFANKVLPLLLLLALLGAGYYFVREDPRIVWSPLPWFLLTCAVYYGLGPLIYHFGTRESVWYLDQFYPITEHDLLRTNMLNAVGITLVILSYHLCTASFHKKISMDCPKYDAVVMRRLLFGFLAIGIPVKYFFVLPYRLGLLNWVLPGSVQMLSVFILFAVIVLFVIVYNEKGNYKVILYLLIASEIVTSLMQFNKQEVIVVLIMIALGLFIFEQNLNKLIVGGILIGIVYVLFLSPFVSFGRLAVRSEGTPSLIELSSSVLEYVQEERLDALGQLPYVQAWWCRLNYANVQAFAMNSYDNGNPGDSYSILPLAIVPRVLYPDKPVIDMGQRFNEMVTGNYYTASSPGLFGEAYWNGGWIYVMLSCLYVGIVFSIFTIISTGHIYELRLVYLPVAFAGILMGLRPDDWFVGTFVAALIQSLMLYVIIKVLVIPALCYRK